ncbi:hypothetical protein F4778DRAFT_393786 [Xylariomycetidae sp. FL2044]|nr:hypothetical protein F4778DRAFT_393786 [Xylariomycetidae sp. FL2044]
MTTCHARSWCAAIQLAINVTVRCDNTACVSGDWLLKPFTHALHLFIHYDEHGVLPGTSSTLHRRSRFGPEPGDHLGHVWMELTRPPGNSNNRHGSPLLLSPSPAVVVVNVVVEIVGNDQHRPGYTALIRNQIHQFQSLSCLPRSKRPNNLPGFRRFPKVRRDWHPDPFSSLHCTGIHDSIPPTGIKRALWKCNA